MIDYNYADDMIVATHRDLLMTDGTVTVSGDTYTVTGATVTITNELLESEAFELKQSLNSGSQIQFGSCEAAQISFTIHENIATVKDKILKVYLIPDSKASEMLQIGVYKVAEDKLSADRTKRTITAYDAMYDILNSDVASWYNSLLPNSSSSCTLAQFRASFLSHFNITAETITLPNDSITIKRTIEPESLSGADVIKAICEINGCFGQISHEGKFRFVELSPDIDSGLFPSDTLYPADDLYPQDVNHDVTYVKKSAYIDVQFEDYLSESITQLTVRESDEDAGVTVGNLGNRYIITGNFLVFGFSGSALTSVATNIFNKIKNRYYKPCTINAIGNPLHEVGDPIRISTTYRGIVTYILERSLKGIQALRDTYTAQGDKEIDGQLNNAGTQFKQLASKTLILRQDIDEVSAKMEEELDDTVVGSYAYQTAQEIGLKVSKDNIVEDLDDEMSGITITSNSIQVSSTGTFTVDSTNFALDSNGDCTLGSVTFTNGELQMTDGEGLSLYHGGIQVSGSGSLADKWLDINGHNSAHGSSEFTNVAINGAEVHIGYDNSTTTIYNCENIYARTTTNDAFIRMNDSSSGLRIQGRNDSRIILDSGDSSYQNWGISLVGDNIDIGISANTTVTIKARTCKWESLTMDGVTRTFLVEA